MTDFCPSLKANDILIANLPQGFQVSLDIDVVIVINATIYDEYRDTNEVGLIGKIINRLVSGGHICGHVPAEF